MPAQLRGARVGAAAHCRRNDASAVIFKVPPTFAMKWLMPRLPRFPVQHPQIELHVSTSLQPADFEAESVDISMQRAVEPDAEFHAIPVLEERGLLVCSPNLWKGRPARLSALDGMTLLHSVKRRDDWASWLEQAGTAKVRPANDSTSGSRCWSIERVFATNRYRLHPSQPRHQGRGRPRCRVGQPFGMVFLSPGIAVRPQRRGASSQRLGCLGVASCRVLQQSAVLSNGCSAAERLQRRDPLLDRRVASRTAPSSPDGR